MTRRKKSIIIIGKLGHSKNISKNLAGMNNTANNKSWFEDYVIYFVPMIQRNINLKFMSVLQIINDFSRPLLYFYLLINIFLSWASYFFIFLFFSYILRSIYLDSGIYSISAHKTSIITNKPKTTYNSF